MTVTDSWNELVLSLVMLLHKHNSVYEKKRFVYESFTQGLLRMLRNKQRPIPVQLSDQPEYAPVDGFEAECPWWWCGLLYCTDVEQFKLGREESEDTSLDTGAVWLKRWNLLCSNSACVITPISGISLTLKETVSFVNQLSPSVSKRPREYEGEDWQPYPPG